MTRPHDVPDMIKFILFLLGFCAFPVLALDCSVWKYPSTEASTEQTEPGLTAEYSRGLLWKVHNQAGQVSYIFGTIHLSDARVIEFSKFVKPYLASVKSFAMEVLVTAETPILLSQKMFYFDGRELGDHLDADVFNRVLVLLRQHGLDDYAASRLKPWAAYMTLSVPPSDDNIPLDMHLLSLANAEGLSIAGIEKIEEQLAIFEDLAINEQVDLLTESICNYEENQKQIEVMLKSYLAQDLQGLASLGERYRTPINEGLLKRLLDDRNEVMVERIVPWLELGNYFIAVGALHVPGSTGLLRALKKQGYTIEAVETPLR